MSALHFLAMGVDILAALGLVVAAVLWAKRVGGAAPWLLAAIGVIDAFMIVLFRLFAGGPGPSSSFEAYERMLNALQLLDAATMFLCGALALVAFFLMMPKTAR